MITTPVLLSQLQQIVEVKVLGSLFFACSPLACLCSALVAFLALCTSPSKASACSHRTRMGPVQTWANIAMVTLGISGAMMNNWVLKWVCFGFGMLLGGLIFFVAVLIFHKAIRQYEEIGHERADEVVQYLKSVFVCV